MNLKLSFKSFLIVPRNSSNSLTFFSIIPFVCLHCGNKN